MTRWSGRLAPPVISKTAAGHGLAMSTESLKQVGWGSARSFEELCELMARFLEGNGDEAPGSGPVEEETRPLIPYLSALNRAGFLTTCSQPGELSAEWRQRAFVEGFALEEEARRIARLSLFTDLHIVAVPPGYSAGFHTPVVVREFMPHGWSGFSSFEEIRFFAEECSPTAIADLRRAWSISAIDLKWGRSEHLWEKLAQALVFSERPHPDLGLEVDFAI